LSHGKQAACDPANLQADHPAARATQKSTTDDCMASTHGFKVGDLVQLLSGGPLMTVEAIRGGDGVEDDSIKCHWFALAQLNKGRFNPATLRLADQMSAKPGG
jgi:uncharacterized protein YodC (DUF2158 family)